MPARTVVTISRQLGCGGAEVGQLVAARLGFHYADRELIHLAAQALGMEDDQLSFRDEKPASLWDKIAGAFVCGAPEVPYIPPPIWPVLDDELFALEGQIIRELVERQDCVVVGRGGACVLKDHGHATHVFLHAPLPFRTDRVMAVYRVPSKQQAIAMIRKSDRERKALLRRLGHCDWFDATRYHVVLDTSTIPLDQAADLIVRYVRLQSGR